jgi:hypothetical protein
MSRVIILTAYGLAGAGLIALIVISWLRPTIVATFATVLDRTMRSRIARLVIIAFWWWLGWHFLVTPPLPR